MGLEKMLPKASSFLPGGLMANVQDYWIDNFKKYTRVEPNDMVKKNTRKIGLACEISRDVFTAAFFYVSGGWWEGTLAIYAIDTWCLDKISYHGIVPGI